MGDMIRKVFEVKAEDATISDTGNGSLQGASSVMGNMDQSCDVIFPGVYKPVLADFAKNGFVALNHQWRELPIGMPTLTEERGRQLYSEFTFHSTEAAQDARKVCRERLAAGLSVGLSVGFMADWDYITYFENGANLLQFAANNGYDMNLFDAATIRAHDDWCRAITRIRKLMEYSVTPMPCNLEAQAEEAKGLTKTFLPEGKNAWRPPTQEITTPAGDGERIISGKSAAMAYRALSARTQAAGKGR